ncbi:hypothetical protein Syun_014366 [Stephania yunnanensis]|uniref:Uncharacterized protein n=1 Tax=Stephania yunnanensis TaxID=152371 RepID=A0AAP0JJ73_9MAGN
MWRSGIKKMINSDKTKSKINTTDDETMSHTNALLPPRRGDVKRCIFKSLAHNVKIMISDHSCCGNLHSSAIVSASTDHDRDFKV